MASSDDTSALRIPTAPIGGSTLEGFGGAGYDRQSGGSAVLAAPAAGTGGNAPGTPKVPPSAAEKLDDFLQSDFIDTYLKDMPGPLRKTVFAAFGFPESGAVAMEVVTAVSVSEVQDLLKTCRVERQEGGRGSAHVDAVGRHADALPPGRPGAGGFGSKRGGTAACPEGGRHPGDAEGA